VISAVWQREFCLKICPWVGLLVAAMALSSLTQAARQSTAEADFESGVAAFRDGDIGKARVLLEQAFEAGLDSSSLRYNLGVVYFRLGLYDQAEAAFTGLLATPHAPLARYNLGLVLQKQGDAEGARAWFKRAADPSSPDQIQALAQQQLASTGSDSSGDFSPDAKRTSETGAGAIRGLGFLSAAAGYDDNITGTPDTETTGEGSGFGDLLASGRVYLNLSRDSVLRLDAVAFTRKYPGNGDLDNSYLSAGASWQEPLGAGRLRSGITLSGFWFGADLLEQKVELATAYERPGCFWPGVLALDCELELFAAKIQGGSDFSAYDGKLYGGSVSLERSTGRWNFDISYRLDIDRRDDLDTGIEFFSLSPTRHELFFGAARGVTDRLSLGAKQTFRFSRYAEPHRLSENGQLRTDTRKDDQFRSLVFANYQLDGRWRLGMELGWVDNQSTLESYQYQRTEFLISLDGLF
jgi:tetratricopeptide (TPR) repeat protein